jgi:hypothetical protein
MGKVSSQFIERSYFLATFSVISLWRIACLWRENINQFHQDEIAWYRDSTTSNFFEYVGIPDSGYPTPLLRAILWIASRALNGNPTYIHILSAVIVALCCTSLLLLRGCSKKDLTVAAIALGCFPSSDLLLWHNLSYYGFIPLMVVFLNGISRSRTGYSTIVVMQILIIFSCKPQLLVANLAVLFLLAARHFRQNHSLAFLYLASSILPLFFLIVGRQDLHSLHLQIGSREFIIGLAALTIVPIAITLPAIFVGISGFLRMYSQSVLIFLLELTLVATQSLFFYSKRTRIKSIIGSERKQITLVSAVPLYVSLFIFGNSTWGNDLFWQIRCTECLFQRHIFPLMVLLIFTLLEIRGKFLRKALIFALLSQLLSLGVFAYSELVTFK